MIVLAMSASLLKTDEAFAPHRGHSEGNHAKKATFASSTNERARQSLSLALSTFTLDDRQPEYQS